LRTGQVIGRSTANGGDPATEPVTGRHIVSTIMQTLFHHNEVRVARGVPDDVARLITEGEPIPGLMG
jgi:hypothetical protein